MVAKTSMLILRPAVCQPARLWILLNLLDVVLSWAAIRSGGRGDKHGSANIRHEYLGIFTYKLFGALMIAVILPRLGKTHMFRPLSTGMALVCLWNAAMLLLCILCL